MVEKPNISPWMMFVPTGGRRLKGLKNYMLRGCTSTILQLLL